MCTHLAVYVGGMSFQPLVTSFLVNLEEPNIELRYYLGTLEDLGTDAPSLASGIAVGEIHQKIIRVHTDEFHPSGYCALAQDLRVLSQIF